MSNFPLQTLQFENHNIDCIEIEGKKYISSVNMANALEYSSSKSVTNLFNTNKAEFIEGEDYTVIDMMTVKNAPYKQIFFSMEGVMGITMLAKTEKASAFRQWARKTLANLPQIPQIAKPSSQEALYELAEGLLKEKALRIEAQSKSIQLENAVQKKNQEIQVLGYEKATVEKNLEIKTAEVKEKEIVIEKARATFKQVADKNGCVGFRECAMQLCIPQKQLRELLEKNKMICPKAKDSKGNKILKPTVSGASYGYVKHATKDGVKLQNGKTAKEFLITEKGFAKLLNQVSGI